MSDVFGSFIFNIILLFFMSLLLISTGALNRVPADSDVGSSPRGT